MMGEAQEKMKEEKREILADNLNWCFPEEITIEIFLRLPVKSLGRLKLVQKTWRALISDPNFAKSHLQFTASKGGKPPLTFLFDACQSISTLKFQGEPEGLTTTPINPPFPEVPDYVSYYCVGSCHGLLCVIQFPDFKAYIWNPTTQEYIHIPFPTLGSCFYGESCFGYIPSANDYKILVRAIPHIYPHDPHSPLPDDEVFVCSVREGKWRKLDIVVPITQNPVLVGETLHCCLDLLDDGFIHRFDLGNETILQKLPLAFGNKLDEGERQLIRGATLGLFKGKHLCVCQVYGPPGFFEDGFSPAARLELWVLHNYSDWDSWKKLYSVDVSSLSFYFPWAWCYRITWDAQVFLRTNEDECVVVNPPNQGPSFIHLQTATNLRAVLDSMASLISPFSLS